jgi:ubiquinone/menaquinone biosynthesis C-methylase UbiE
MEKNTSWQKVSSWYDSIVSDQGHYYHQKIVLPGVLRLLGLQKNNALLDLACGQGILARAIPPNISYVGIDAAKSLIAKAKSYSAPQKNHSYYVGDITKPLPLPKEALFSHAAIVLAIQNLADPENALRSLRPHLQPGGKLVIVLNHPCFRIPRQSSWGFDEASKTQYRRLNGYMSPQTIPITCNPGKKESETTVSFHLPLTAYFAHLAGNGFAVTLLEEWCSDKVSTGGAAKWENRARKEFPLFLALQCVRSS